MLHPCSYIDPTRRSYGGHNPKNAIRGELSVEGQEYGRAAQEGGKATA